MAPKCTEKWSPTPVSTVYLSQVITGYYAKATSFLAFSCRKGNEADTRPELATVPGRKIVRKLEKERVF